jgi:hypothetical protein
MSDKWPHFGTHESKVASEEAGSSSVNGAEPEDAVAGVDGSIGEVTASQTDQADQTTAASDIADESHASGDTAVADAVAVADDAPAADDTPAADDPPAADDTIAATAADGDPATAADQGASDDGVGFLSELARAMQTTVGLERVRTDEETERRHSAHIDGVRTREATQADRIRALAHDDMAAIDAWADGETKRIQTERERRAAELNKDLEASLSEHHAKIEREIEGVEVAIAGYRAEVIAFFEGLDRETDPVLIAQHAARRPIFPTLVSGDDAVTAAEDAVTAAEDAVAAPEAVDEPQPVVVGVMDPAASAEPVSIESLAPLQDASPAPGDQAESAEPVTAAIGSSEGGSEPLLQTVPAHRPMSWLRRDSNGGDRPNADD